MGVVVTAIAIPIVLACCFAFARLAVKVGRTQITEKLGELGVEDPEKKTDRLALGAGCAGFAAVAFCGFGFGFGVAMHYVMAYAFELEAEKLAAGEKSSFDHEMAIEWPWWVSGVMSLVLLLIGAAIYGALRLWWELNGGALRETAKS